MNFDIKQLFWTFEPEKAEIKPERISIVTEPGTDLWKRTYYGTEVTNAPMLQMKSAEPYFTFSFKASFEYKKNFDQCGAVIYLDSENWMKASIEAENEDFQRLGSVVTNHSYSDWASQDIPADITEVWYRLSRREKDFLIEYSLDGETFRQMRIFRLIEGGGEIAFGLYACSPDESSFEAVFSEFSLGECLWTLHGE